MSPRNAKFNAIYKLDFINAIGPIGALSIGRDSSLDEAFDFFTQRMDASKMPSIKELREQRGELNKQFQDIVRKAESENRDITPKEHTTLNQINEDDKALVNRIQRIEDADARNEGLTKVLDLSGQRRGIVSNGGRVYIPDDQDFAVAALIQNGMGQPVNAETWDRAEQGGFRPGASALEIPLNLIRPTPGNQVSFLPRNAMHTQIPSKGGAWIPAGFMERLEAALKQFGPMLETSEIWVSEDGRESPWPTINDASNEGFLVGENQPANETELSVGATIFSAHKASSGLLKVSYEMLRDTPINLAGEIGNAFGIRLGRLLNRLCTVGDTPNSPQGIVPRAPVGKETASGTALAADEVIDLISSVDPAYRAMPGSGFMMHPDVFAAISKFKDSQNQYLTGTLEAGAKSKLRGYPVAFNPHMSSTFAAGEKIMLFGDLQAYKIRLVGSIRLRQMVEKFADSDQTGFVAFVEFDGHLLDAGTHPVKALQLKVS